jgi:hypothetical protein
VIVRVRDALARDSDQLLPRMADERAERVVDAQVAPVEVEDHHPDQSVVE